MMHIHQECFGLNGFKTPLRPGNSVFFNSVSFEEVLSLQYVVPGQPLHIYIYAYTCVLMRPPSI